MLDEQILAVPKDPEILYMEQPCGRRRLVLRVLGVDGFVLSGRSSLSCARVVLLTLFARCLHTFAAYRHLIVNRKHSKSRSSVKAGTPDPTCLSQATTQTALTPLDLTVTQASPPISSRVAGSSTDQSSPIATANCQ